MILSVSSITNFRAMFTILSLTVSNVMVCKIIRNAHEARRMSQENSKETLSLDQLLSTSDNDFRSKNTHRFRVPRAVLIEPPRRRVFNAYKVKGRLTHTAHTDTGHLILSV